MVIRHVVGLLIVERLDVLPTVLGTMCQKP